VQDVSDKEMFFSARERGFGDEPKRRIMLGTFASSSGFYDAYYERAEKVMVMLREQFQKAFKEVDLILIPTSPEFPFKIGDKSSNPLAMYLVDIMTISANLTRIAAINVPLGLASPSQKSTNLDSVNAEQTSLDTPKLPVGCQVLGPEFSEPSVYKLAFEIEQLVKNQK
jgi:aspartyl-tRNA(Asn)/glutamyl-tRNA(Gln) amidotransferase subunit A